jgi:hypothetical protein
MLMLLRAVSQIPTQTHQRKYQMSKMMKMTMTMTTTTMTMMETMRMRKGDQDMTMMD